MEINLYTKNLIILKYPSNAGGKFISLCLAINEKILHQDKYLAKKKITKKLTQLNSFKISKSILEKKISIQQHFELGCDQLAGFKAKHSVIEQEKLAKNNFSIINCSIGELEDRMKSLPSGRKQIAIARYEDQVTVVINELDQIF